MSDEKKKYIEKIFMESVPEYRAARFLKRLIAALTLLVVLVLIGDNLDKPRSTGEALTGKIISIASVQEGYRTLNATKLATIHLEDGRTLYKKMKSASVGQSVQVQVYQRPLTRIKSYEL